MTNFNPRSPHRERPLIKSRTPYSDLFQSTLPSQGATRTTLTIQALIMVFQSTLPSQGATFPHLVNLFANVDFNPRSPHRERHRSYIYTLEKSNFNPRSPHRERLVPLTMAGAAYQFQSTLPSQGATKIVEDVTFSSDISIHAPLTGSDLGRLDRYIRYADISIHAPLTGSDFRFPARFMVFDISIHAPLTGSDIQWQLSGRCCGISIHAPLTGSDRAAMVSPETTSRFQSTLPSQGATIGKQKLQKALQFQSTLPSQGATIGDKYGVSDGIFQSTLPSQGATSAISPFSIVYQISIHAPLTGSDLLCCSGVPTCHISIHAPLTGSDVFPSPSTSTIRYFNPRSPHRERRD